MKTSELIGAQLDWAVAKCCNRTIRYNLGGGLEVRGRTEDGKELPDQWDLWMYWSPSNNWEQGGPIIEREGITVKHVLPTMTDSRWQASMYQKAGRNEGIANTPLIAAMRCYVASKLGDEVEIPEELK